MSLVIFIVFRVTIVKLSIENGSDDVMAICFYSFYMLTRWSERAS